MTAARQRTTRTPLAQLTVEIPAASDTYARPRPRGGRAGNAQTAASANSLTKPRCCTAPEAADKSQNAVYLLHRVVLPQEGKWPRCPLRSTQRYRTPSLPPQLALETCGAALDPSRKRSLRLLLGIGRTVLAASHHHHPRVRPRVRVCPTKPAIGTARSACKN